MPTKTISRRDFMQINSAALFAVTLPSSLFFKKYKPLLSFSTLGCPDWSFKKIGEFARSNNYNGIEVRGIQREMDLTKATPFNSRENIAASLGLMHDYNLELVNLGSSATLHFPAGVERQKNIDEGKRFIDLAQQLSCPYIRVFPNNFPAGQDKEKTKELITNGLLELGNYAGNTNVTVLMETHGDVVYIADIVQIMQASEHKHVGLVWDAYNMWSVTKESPVAAYTALKKYIRHVHIKDAKQADGKAQYVLTGAGTSPIFEAVDILAKNKFAGYYSFEWEKLWHPEIEEPEIAIADYPKAIARRLQKHPG